MRIADDPCPVSATGPVSGWSSPAGTAWCGARGGRHAGVTTRNGHEKPRSAAALPTIYRTSRPRRRRYWTCGAWPVRAHRAGREMSARPGAASSWRSTCDWAVVWQVRAHQRLHRRVQTNPPVPAGRGHRRRSSRPGRCAAWKQVRQVMPTRGSGWRRSASSVELPPTGALRPVVSEHGATANAEVLTAEALAADAPGPPGGAVARVPAGGTRQVRRRRPRRRSSAHSSRPRRHGGRSADGSSGAPPSGLRLG